MTDVSARSSPREVVAYLLRLRPVLANAIQMRRGFIEQVGVLIEGLRQGDPISIARLAGQLGNETSPMFREARHQIDALDPPPMCAACNRAISDWLEVHLSACALLGQIGTQHDAKRLREVQEHLAQGRTHATRFNEEYTHIKTDLREQVDRVLGRRRRGGGPAGFLRRLFGSQK